MTYFINFQNCQLLARPNDNADNLPEGFKPLNDYVRGYVDDSCNASRTMPAQFNMKDARLCVWQCGFEPMIVVVGSYLPDVELDSLEAQELAQDWLIEDGWFTTDNFTMPDHVI